MLVLNKISEQKVSSKNTTTTNSFFPFFGAGFAKYYQSFEIDIKFVKKPSNSLKNKIILNAPKPILIGLTNFNQKTLMVYSDQYINYHINKAYVLNQKKTRWQENESFQIIPEAAVLFENQIEKWLRYINSICAIEFVLRPQDIEAGGTQFSDWHYKSVAVLPSLIKTWNKKSLFYNLPKKEKEAFAKILIPIIQFSQITPKNLPNNFRDLFFPEYKIKKLLKNNDLTEAFHAILQNINFKEVQNLLQDKLTFFNKKKQYENTLLFTEIALSYAKKEVIEKLIIGAEEISYALVIQNNQALIASFIDLICQSDSENKSNYVNKIGKKAFAVGKLKKYTTAISLYEMATSITNLSVRESELPIYNNALKMLNFKESNAIDTQNLMPKFINNCIIYAPKNPEIYFSTAILQIGYNQFDAALGNVKLAINHNYNQIPQMIKAIKREKYFTAFKNYKPLILLLKTLKN